jgi:hypothetical protein
MHSIGGFYAGSTSNGEEAVKNNTYPELSPMLSSALPIDLPSIGVCSSPEEEVEIDDSNIALGIFRQGFGEKSNTLPLTVVGSCCRLNDRFVVSKENAFRIGASLGVLPSELKAMAVPDSWRAVFSDEISF